MQSQCTCSCCRCWCLVLGAPLHNIAWHTGQHQGFPRQHSPPASISCLSTCGLYCRLLLMSLEVDSVTGFSLTRCCLILHESPCFDSRWFSQAVPEYSQDLRLLFFRVQSSRANPAITRVPELRRFKTILMFLGQVIF